MPVSLTLDYHDNLNQYFIISCFIECRPLKELALKVRFCGEPDSGSSPRNILRTGGNLLGVRALRYELYPLLRPIVV